MITDFIFWTDSLVLPDMTRNSSKRFSQCLLLIDFKFHLICRKPLNGVLLKVV